MTMECADPGANIDPIKTASVRVAFNKIPTLIWSRELKAFREFPLLTSCPLSNSG